MTTAFKCDSCGKFTEGKPSPYVGRKVRIRGWANLGIRFDFENIELCDECKRKLVLEALEEA